MSRWFRFYDDALNDKKVQRLAPNLFKTWVNLLCLASKGGGKIPSDDDISFELRISVSDAKQQLEDLILAGLVDICADGSREPHNWQERQFLSDTSAERTRKYRERLKKKPCDVTVTDDVTPPESESYTDTDTESVSSLVRTFKAKRKKQGLNLISDVMKDDEEPEVVKRNASGLGLNVESLLAITHKRAKNNKAAYFTKLCVTELLEKYPTEKEAFLRDALWGKGRALNDLYGRIMGATQ